MSSSDLPLHDLPTHALSLVIPMYNEVDNVAPLVARVHEALGGYPHPWELVLVDDGSTDGTGDAIRREAARHGAHVRPVELARNFKQTAAMQAGIDAARGDVIATLDGDLQNDPVDIPRMVARLLREDLDLVAGWRRDRKDGLWLRKIPSRIANRLIARLTGVRLRDYGCSLKVFRAPALKKLRLYGEMHRFIPIYASWFGARIAEIPVLHHPRQNGVSKYGLGRIVKVILDLMVVNFLSKYAGKPMYIFGAAGLFILLLSLLTGGWAEYLKLVEGVSFISTPLPLLVVMTAVTGFMCILMGLLAELLIRTYYEAQGKSVYLVGKTLNIKTRCATRAARCVESSDL